MTRKRRSEPRPIANPATGTSNAPALHHAHDSAELLKMERLLLFTDAVFAIIMTLLALEVRLPDGANLSSTQGVIDALAATSGKFGAYALSFIVIAMMWNTHLRRYRYLTSVDGRIIAGNILQLLLTGLIPFATSMIARAAQPLVVAFYAGVMTLNILVGWITWRIAIADPHRVSSQFTPETRRERDWRSLSTAAIFAGSMPIAFKAPVTAMLLWALQIPANRLIQKFILREGQARSQS